MSVTTAELQASLAAAVEAAGQAVVRVEGRRRAPASGVVWSTDGLVLTAHHGVETDGELEVGLPDGRSVTAELVGRDPGTDLALLRLAEGGLAPPEWAGPGELKVGHLVLALSRPGRSVRASLGVVSVLGESWRTRSGGRLEHYLQTDVALHPGFSGGPLVGLDGRALGVDTAGLLRGTPLTLTRPTLERVVAALLAGGRVRRGFLGIGTFPVRLPAELAQALEQESGLLVLSVEPGSPAAQAGLLLGDALVAIDGAALGQPADLLPFLDEERVGREARLSVLRAGERRELGIVIGERGRRPA